jgi:signal transduction histidine kinase
MSTSRRSSRLAPGSALLIGLLLLMLGLSSVLAYQAMDAARSEARSTERALRGYAGLARWELSRRTDQALAHKLSMAAEKGAAQAQAVSAAGGGLAALRSGVGREMRWCACPQAVRGVFRIDAKNGARSVSTLAMPPALHRALVELAGTLQAAPGTDTVRVWALNTGSTRQLIVYHLRASGGTLRAHGFALDAHAAALPVLREVMRGAPLLPVLRGGFTNENAMVVAVADHRGQEVFRSPVPPALPTGRDGAWMDARVGSPGVQGAQGSVVEEMGGLLSGLTARVSMRPAVVAGRVGDRAPESRLPLLLAVFGLTLALFGIAVVQLRRQQELVRLRDDFVSGVSHELRTPLAQIRLFADLLESGRLGDPAQRARSVRIINEESRRLTYLVENILHFSRAQRAASRLSPTPVDVGALVREVVDGFAPLAHHVEFATRVEPGVVARMDHDAFRQVLLNLLDNAAKYAPRGSVVQVGMAVVGFDLRIWVRDGGPGVPREDRARIWEPYRRLDREADAAVGGSGIGLAVVKDVVALHGGRVWVDDAPGGGARFVVQIPGATYAGPPGEEEAAASAALVQAGAR